MPPDKWHPPQPIYRQLRDRVVAMIIDGTLQDGDALPSARRAARELRLNPITVLKGYQQLVDDALVEKRRGLGLFITRGTRAALMREERRRFLEEEWPRVDAIIQRLGLSTEELIGRLKAGAPPASRPGAALP